MEAANRSTLLKAALATLAIGPVVGCTGPVGTTASSMLRRVKESPDPNVRHLAYAKLGSERAYDSDSEKVEVARVLSERLNSGKEPLASRVAICRTLGELGRPEARDAILKCVTERDSVLKPGADRDEPAVRTAACRALGRVGRPDDWTVLAQVMATDFELDCRIAAIEGLAVMNVTDPRLDLMLVDGMEHTEPAIRMASLQALQKRSGKDLGEEPKAWKEYADGLVKLAAADAAPRR